MAPKKKMIRWWRSRLLVALSLWLVFGAEAQAQGPVGETTPESAAEAAGDDELLVQAEPEAAASGGEADIWAGVEELIVTGTDAAGVLADIARSNSVTAFSSEDLNAIGAADISDIASFTPNLEIVTAGSTSPTFFIRGIGLNDFNANAAGAVAIYTDDVPLNSPALQLGSLFDIEATNVLRGPQGTGPFRNASAGAIKIYSKKPTGEYGAFFRSDLGNYNSRDFEGAVQFPITEETLWGRAAFRYVERDGTMRNRCSGAPPREGRQVNDGSGPGDDPRWSFCGESVQLFRVSLVDPDQPKWINSRENWAGRLVFLYQPDVFDIEQEWQLTMKGGRRDEPSTVGQSIGTNGVQRYPELPREPDGSIRTVVGLLGAPDAGRYRDTDVIEEQAELNNEFLSACAPRCNLRQRRDAQSFSDRVLARNLARDLDQDPYAGAFSHTGGTTNSTWGFALKGTIDATDDLVFTSITGYDGWDRKVDTDLDFSPNTLFEVQTADDGYQIFQEFRLEGQSFHDLDEIFGGPLGWSIGAFALREDLDVEVDINFGENAALSGAPKRREYNQEVTSGGAFIEFDWDFWEVFTFDGGFRYNWELREIDYTLFVTSAPRLQNEEINGEEPTGTLRLTYRPTEETSVYAKYTRGWKSGTFNATGSQRLGVRPADAEKIDSYEIGLSGSYFEDRVNLLTAMFHYKYRNYQLFTAQEAFQSPPEFVILNAPDVELYGAEVEVQVTPWDGGLVDVRFAWLEGEFLEFSQTLFSNDSEGATPIFVARDVDFSGNRLLNAPQYTVTLTLQQTFPLGRLGSLTARWDGTWKDDTYFDASEGQGVPNVDNEIFLPEDTIGQRAYWVHNVRLAYNSPGGEFELAGWVRNLTDESYKTFSANLSSFQQTTLHFVGDPFTWGISTQFKF